MGHLDSRLWVTLIPDIVIVVIMVTVMMLVVMSMSMSFMEVTIIITESMVMIKNDEDGTKSQM